MKEHRMFRAFIMHGRDVKFLQTIVGKVEARDHLGDLG
jgi:hypothetical protein